MRFSTVGLVVTLTLGSSGATRCNCAAAAKVPQIGYLSTGGQRLSCSSHDFLQGLHEFGYVEGRNIIIEWRCAEGRPDWARQFADELVQLGVDVLVSFGRAASLAAKAATRTIPIVFVAGGDPVVGGLVPSLAQPGGNITGVTNLTAPAFFAKHLELLLEAVPGLASVALLLQARDPANAERIAPVETAARTVEVHLHLVEVETPNDFEAAFSAVTQQGVSALLVSFTPLLTAHNAQLGALAAKYRLPAIEQEKGFAEAGGLIAYGASRSDMFRRVAAYVERSSRAPNRETCPWSGR